MSRVILLVCFLAVFVAVAATAQSLKLPKSAAAQHHAALVAKPIDPATMTTHLQKVREEMALP